MGSPFKHMTPGAFQKYRDFVAQYYDIGRKFNDVKLFDEILTWVQPIGQGGCPEYLIERLSDKYNKDYKQPGFWFINLDGYIHKVEILDKFFKLDFLKYFSNFERYRHALEVAAEMLRTIVIVNEEHVVQHKFFNPENFASIEAFERVSKQLADVMTAFSKGERAFNSVICKLAQQYRRKLFPRIVTSNYIDNNCQFMG